MRFCVILLWSVFFGFLGIFVLIVMCFLRRFFWGIDGELMNRELSVLVEIGMWSI